MPVDFIGLFTLLIEARVRFVVVGGLALLLHGLDRPTVDVMLDPVVKFSDLYQAATVITIGGAPVRVASIPHLITLKEAAGRPQDHADIERLRALPGN